MIRSIVFDLHDVLVISERTWIETESGLERVVVYQELPERGAILEDLAKSYRLFLLSNAKDMHVQTLKSQLPDLLKHFEGIAYSQEIGSYKPDPRIYQHLLSKFQLDPHTTLYIDDKHINCKTAEALGMHTLHFTPGSCLLTLLRKRLQH